MAVSVRRCSDCSTEFRVMFRYQVQRTAAGIAYFCSPQCVEKAAKKGDSPVCEVCSAPFALTFAYQVMARSDGTRRLFCSTACRERADAAPTASTPAHGARKIAVLNQKGGTGKTTTAVSIAAGIAEAGHRTLLVDVDAQGNVGVCLGVRGEKTLYHVMVEGTPPSDCAVPVRDNLDVITANETLAHAEVYLARMGAQRDGVMRGRLAALGAPYDYVILDCGPSISLLNQNALSYADEVLIPVSCDYLSLVGVKQVLRTIRSVNEVLQHPVSILGVLPTFYDMRLRIARDAIKTLGRHFDGKVLPPVRVNTRLKEAPATRKTIFEYAPHSNGAADYRHVVEWIVGTRAAAARPLGHAALGALAAATAAEARAAEAGLERLHHDAPDSPAAATAP
ncbi:MAG TPA: ParA family protein [Myxococcota bacterium]|jgi:chromosome partitioning protein|nr:ParA family protein [Myxococcota bacterium]